MDLLGYPVIWWPVVGVAGVVLGDGGFVLHNFFDVDTTGVIRVCKRLFLHISSPGLY